MPHIRKICVIVFGERFLQPGTEIPIWRIANASDIDPMAFQSLDPEIIVGREVGGDEDEIHALFL